MRKLLLATALSMGALVGTANADVVIIDDPLHGQCPGCSAQNIGGNDVTLLGPNGVIGFGFASSPEGSSGDLVLKFLIPDNFTLTQVNDFIAGVKVTGTNQPVGGTSMTLFTSAQFGNTWTAADGVGLEGFLGLNAQPPNPLDAWLGATKTEQPTATGYYVLTADMGQFTLGGQSDPLADIFALSPASYPQGGLIAANLLNAIDKNGHDLGTVSTAQSSALYFGDSVAVPGPIVGAGIPGLVAALGGMFGLNFYRRRRNNSHLPA
jgi:hypothetical protein